MCKFAEIIFHPHHFATTEIVKEETSSDLCLGQLNFQRVCENVLRETGNGVDFTKEALHALQVASESMICEKFKDGLLRAASRTDSSDWGNAMVERGDF